MWPKRFSNQFGHTVTPLLVDYLKKIQNFNLYNVHNPTELIQSYKSSGI